MTPGNCFSIVAAISIERRVLAKLVPHPPEQKRKPKMLGFSLCCIVKDFGDGLGNSDKFIRPNYSNETQWRLAKISH